MSEQWVRKTITAELLSNAHFGSGSGDSGIDALVARDRRNRPVVWASHLEGVLRDAARRLRGDDDAESFFGRAGGEQQRAVFTSLYTTDDPEPLIWRAAARKNFDNRAPKDETLRVVEYVPKGTTFVGEVELPARQLATLARLLHEVDALGSSRSTGAGRVKLSLSEATARSRKANTPTDHLVLLLKNRDPLCITATATPDNFVPSLAFVPGRTLLGAVAAWLIAEGERDAASLLTSGKISVSDALPLPNSPSKLDGLEVLPAPLSLKSEKPAGCAGDVPWWAHDTAPAKRLDAWRADTKLKRPEDDLFVFREHANAPWVAFRPARRVRLRNGRPDPMQRDTLLFAVEQIVEETHFLAELHGTPDDMRKLAEKLEPVLQGRRWLRIGRAGAPVEVAQLAWGAVTPVPKVASKAVLTLTSDLLVRDSHLRWRTELDRKALAELLGDDVHLGRSLQDSVMVHGFNGTSRLWRMPAAAIRRGAVFAISGTGVPKVAERAARREWLGERTHEGFGRFRVDSELPGLTTGTSASRAPTITSDVDEETIAERTFKWFTEHKALVGSDNERAPSLSQWQDLVSALDRNDANALTSRLSPTTAGGRGWMHPEAKEILKKLSAIAPSPEEQARYARLFVRWLRTAMPKER